MRHAGDGAHGHRLRGLIVVLWRAGLRICEALALAEADDTVHARRAPMVPIDRSGANATTGGGKAAPCPPPALAGITGDEPDGERLAECSIHREAAIHAG